MKKFLKKANFVFLLIALGFLVHHTQTILDRPRIIRFVDKRPIFLPRGEVLKWLSMGYRGLVGDWLWINSVLYYGRRVIDHGNPYFEYASKKGEEKVVLDHYRYHSHISEGTDSMLSISQRLEHILYNAESRGLVDYIYPMLDRVTTLDPHFVLPYIFGGVYVLMDTGEIDQAEKLLEKGRAANPKRWEFPFYLGWIQWMYRQNMEKTYKYLLEAVVKEERPQFVENLVAGLSKNLERNELTRLYLQGLLESTDNPEIRGQIEEFLLQINSEN